jgi:hypothetical protein
MKKTITFILLLTLINANAQIGGGWDWAFNTGSLGGTTFKYMKYTAAGSEILMGGQALAAANFGSTTLTAPPQLGYPGNIKFFGKINAVTGVSTIIRSFINIPVNFDCITTDDTGNFYIGGAFVGVADFDLGNGVTIPASAFKMGVIAKFDSSGNTLWAKTYSMGTIGSSNVQILKLAVSPAGNIFFWGWNYGGSNYPLYKLDANGNTIWFKNGTGKGVGSIDNSNSYLSDKFIDNDENVHLFVRGSGTGGYTFDGIDYPGGSIYGYSTLISLNAAGTITMAKTTTNAFSHFQVNRSTGNLSFGWSQNSSNPDEFQNLPHPLASLSPYYANSFNGIVETDKNFNLLKAKDFSSTADNPFSISLNYDKFISLPNGKLLIVTEFYKDGAYSAGVNSVYPADATKYASAIIETDTNWNMDKFISGGKAGDAGQTYIAAYNDTYLLGAEFSAVAAGGTTTSLPTTSFGTVNLTGFNAAADMTTAYGIYSTNSGLRKDVAIAQCKSGNFPKIASTTWLGTTNNWDLPSNWSNGVPTTAMKAVFDAPTANYPTLSASPTAASLEINSGVTLTLPNTLALTGGVKNEGTIVINNAGYFQGFGSKEWKGNGAVNFTGTAVNNYFPGLFTNSLVLNTNLTTQYDLTIPSITFNGGLLNMNAKKISITNPSSTAISGTSATSYFFGGTLERAVNSTGVYEFPVGTNTNFQSASIAANNLVGVSKIATTFNSGAITGTTPNTSSKGVSITTALNGGWYTITPNSQPTSGTYDVTLAIKGATNTVVDPEKYTIIKRDNSTSDWTFQGVGTLATVNSETVTAKNTGLTSFSDFAIGIGTQKITLGNETFVMNTSKVSIFPNPTSDIAAIYSTENIKSIALYDVSGKQQNTSSKNSQIDLNGFSSGIYFLKILLENGEVQIQKIIKK